MTTVIVQHSFAAFAWLIVLAIVVVIFCIIYFWIRRKGKPPQIDDKAGDEGED